MFWKHCSNLQLQRYRAIFLQKNFFLLYFDETIFAGYKSFTEKVWLNYCRSVNLHQFRKNNCVFFVDSELPQFISYIGDTPLQTLLKCAVLSKN